MKSHATSYGMLAILVLAILGCQGIEHNKVLVRVMTSVMKDDTELFKQFMDNEGFKRWMTDMVFDLTYAAE